MDNEELNLLSLPDTGPVPARSTAGIKAARARKLADLLEMQSLQGPQQQVVGGRVVPVGWTGALGQLAQGFGASKFREKAEGLEAQASTEQAQALASSLKNYMTQRESDPRGAALAAISSGNPALQKAGLLDFQALNRAKPEAKIPGNVEVHEGEGQWKKFVVGPDGLPDKTRPIDDAPFNRTPGATNVSQSMKVEAKGREELLKQGAQGISPGGKSYEEAQGATKSLSNYAEALQSINEGANSGMAEPVVQGFRKALEAIGIPDAATGPTDNLSAQLQRAAFNKLGGLGAQISDADRQFVTKSQGDLTTNPQALKRMLALDAAMSMMSVEKHNTRADALGEATDSRDITDANKFRFDFSFDKDPEMAAMIDNVLRGRPTTAGLQATAPTTVTGKQEAKKPKSDAEYRSLPAGTLYIAPDGSIRRKK